MSIAILAGTPGGPSVQVQGLLAAAQAFGGFVGGFVNFAAGVIQGAAGQVPADSIVLLNTNILDWHRRNETSGPNYTWTRHTIRLRAIYNPLLNSFVQANPQQPAVFRLGFKAPVTDAAIRHALAQPRRKFMLFVGGTLSLESPRGRTTVDAQNGPFVKVNRVSLVSGTKTYLVDLTIETCVNESHLFTNKPSVMLAHTYSSSHDVDQDFYTTRVIHGRATFDTGRLVALGARADDFRAYLFHNISPGFHRVSINAQVDEGGGELAYTIVDREVTHSLGELCQEKGCTRIQCTHDSEISKPDFWEQAIGTAGIVGQSAWDWVAGNRKRGGNVKGHIITGVVGAVEGIWKARKNIPVNTQTIVCSAWGNNNSQRGGLREVVGAVLNFRMQNLPTSSGATHMSWHDDVKGAYVRGTLRVTRSPVGAFLSSGVGRPLFAAPPGAEPGIEFPARLLELSETIPTVLSKPPLFGVPPPADGPAASLFSDIGARGTYIESLVSSALLAPNQAPPPVGNTPYARHREPPDGTATDPKFN